jgi:hypothetical protein
MGEREIVGAATLGVGQHPPRLVDQGHVDAVGVVSGDVGVEQAGQAAVGGAQRERVGVAFDAQPFVQRPRHHHER